MNAVIVAWIATLSVTFAEDTTPLMEATTVEAGKDSTLAVKEIQAVEITTAAASAEITVPFEKGTSELVEGDVTTVGRSRGSDPAAKRTQVVETTTAAANAEITVPVETGTSQLVEKDTTTVDTSKDSAPAVKQTKAVEPTTVSADVESTVSVEAGKATTAASESPTEVNAASVESSTPKLSLPKTRLPWMVRVLMKDGSAVDYYVNHRSRGTFKKATNLCKNMGMEVASFENAKVATKVIMEHRRRMCRRCEGRAWIAGIKNDTRGKEGCAYVSLKTGKIGESELCDIVSFRESLITMDGYVCSEVVKPTEWKPSHKTIVSSKVIPWKSKDGKVLYHYVVRDKGITYEDAVRECNEYGYKIPTVEDDEEVDNFGKYIREVGSYWVAPRKEDSEDGCIVLVIDRGESFLSAKECDSDYFQRRRRDRIIGYICTAGYASTTQ
ncbi:hypothetical protein ANCCAN_09732 [Ancylostoma caninum]|uniref:C-type lectin domain-containing protein n=1 Tax=Ancylostoma caninum TaxID=29170 RepID=A0A368GMM5_ANCCA|nr:hypothetical protein ANCCAN_09732 [Ancylostoma caninum]